MESHQNKIISVENITVDFGNFRALDNVSAENDAPFADAHERTCALFQRR